MLAYLTGVTSTRSAALLQEGSPPTMGITRGFKVYKAHTVPFKFPYSSQNKILKAQ